MSWESCAASAKQFYSCWLVSKCKTVSTNSQNAKCKHCRTERQRLPSCYFYAMQSVYFWSELPSESVCLLLSFCYTHWFTYGTVYVFLRATVNQIYYTDFDDYLTKIRQQRLIFITTFGFIIFFFAALLYPIFFYRILLNHTCYVLQPFTKQIITL